MTTLALGAAGAAAGGFIGGGFGAQVGFAAGTFLGGVLFPETLQQQGPKLNDLRVTDSSYGRMLPIVYGTIPVPGNVIDASDLIETKHIQKTGGGKGGGGPVVENKTFTYSVDLAIALCEGPIAGLLQLYANEILIYDATPTAAVSKPAWLKLKVYTGSETQSPDPTLEALHGAGNVPGYRGVAYIVLRRFELEQFGNRLPNFRAVVAVDGSLSNADTTTTDTMISSVGVLQRHPNTGAVFVTGNGDATINGRAYNPFGGEPLFNLSRESGGAPDNSNEGGFFSVPLIVDGETYELGPNAHFYLGNSLGHGISVYDAYTGAFVAAVYLENVGSGDNLSAVTINEKKGQIARIIAGPPYRLLTYNMHNKGPLWNGSTELSTTVTEPDEAASPSDWQWYAVFIPNGTDRNGVIALTGHTVAAGDDYFLTIENSLIRAKTTTGLSAFASAADVGIVWDSTRALFWVIGEKAGDASTTVFKAYDRDAAVIETHEATMTYSLVVAEDFDEKSSSIYLVRISTGTLYRFDTGTGDVDSWTGFPSAGGWNWTGLAWHAPTDTAWTPHNVGDKIISMTPDRLSTSTTTLDDIAGDLLDRADVDSGDYDVTGLSSVTVRGYRIGRRTTARAAMEPLRMGYLWDLVDNGAKLAGILRGQSSALTLDSEDLGAQEDAGEPVPMIKVSRIQDIELPRELTISYLDFGAYYEEGTQRAIRLASPIDEAQDLALPLVFSEDEAAQLCEVLLHGFQIEREQYRATTHLEHIGIEGADVVTLTDDNNSYNARIISTDIVGPMIEIEAVREYDVYTSTADGAPTITHAPTVVFGGPTLLFLLDIPLLLDADEGPGFYAAAGSYTDGWPGCGLFKSVDLVTYTFAEGIGQQASFGFVQGAAATAPLYVWDEVNTLVVALTSGELASCTDVECFNETNAAIWGQAGRWELILFRTVVDNADGTWDVSGLIRGMRGTGHNRANHQAGDLFIVADADTISRVGIQVADIDQTVYYKGVTYGDTVDASTSAELAFTPAAVGLKPWAPVHIEITGFGGDITINFYRQDRIKAAALQQPPQSEASASYEIDIIDNVSSPSGSVIRTISVSAETATYTSAQQTTDFGGTVTTLEVNVYQISATVDRGYAANASV